MPKHPMTAYYGRGKERRVIGIFLSGFKKKARQVY